ncbi:MAG: hypothetical protein WC670_17010 [Pseudolabrys sp.]|jgi:hypothetical protein
MASFLNCLAGAGLALALYGLIGLPLAQRAVPRPMAPWLAPVLGWSAHSALALPLFFAIGLNRTTVFAGYLLPLALAAFAIWRQRPQPPSDVKPLPLWLLVVVLGGAALIALDLMAVDLPKYSSEGVTLAAPIFDHSKIAMIDEMTRLGVPPGNPFYGGEGPARLSYYYLWHFSAAELSALTGLSGWEADAGMSAFTGFAAVVAIAGIAIWLSGRAGAALWVVILAATGAARPVLNAVLGIDAVEAVAGVSSGFGGFLFQTSWAPQHTMAALTAVIAIVVLVALVERPRPLTTVLLGLLMAAAFESSTWIGGIAFPLMAAPVALVMLARAPAASRLRVIVHLAVAALIALALISPFLYDQAHMAALRNDGTPVTIKPVDVLGDDIRDAIGAFWNGPAYWLIYLPVELPAIYLAGIAGFVGLLRDRHLPIGHRALTVALALAALASLACNWLLLSTLGENNDLGWRAGLPAVLILMVAAAAGLSRLTLQSRPLHLAGGAAAIALIAIGLVDGVRFGYGNVAVDANPSTRTFASSEALWRAVRLLTPPGERVANNPGYMAAATPWPVNISWALLADRRACFAGRDLVRPFSALPAARVEAIDQQFTRIFQGAAQPDDVAQLANLYRCDTAVVVPSDGAWGNDPFVASAHYKLAEETPGWRIYRRVRP